MSKTKSKRIRALKVVESEGASEIRSLGPDAWPSRGHTAAGGDGGLGTKAKGFLASLGDADQKAARQAYDKCVQVVGKLSPTQQRAIAAALGSSYAWEALIAKSKQPGRPVWKNADQESWDRLSKMVGPAGEPLPLTEIMARFQAVKAEVSAERKARREKRSA